MEDETQDATAGHNATGAAAAKSQPQSQANIPRLTVVELAPLSIGSKGTPTRKATLTCELPEAIAEQIRPGMTWDGQEWQNPDGEPVAMRELSTA